MAISIKRYVDVTSGVGAGAGVRTRELIGRLFTVNPLLPTGSFGEFGSADEVGAYFGTTSEEYKRALFYFGWVSKNIKRAKKISFARWADAATAPQIYGKVANYALSAFTGITAGTFSLTLGATTNTIGPLNFSTATSLSDVAAAIQTAIRSKTGAMWTGATVTYNATRKSFDFVGGQTGAAVISVAAGSPDVALALGWLTGATLSNGSALQTVSDVLTQSADGSSNFGSFLFMRALSLAEVTEAATWNDARNVQFMFTPSVLAVDAANYYAALAGLSGVTVTLSATSGEYPEMVPMIVLAATDYTARNAVQNYMFQQFTLTPSVTTDADANTYDAQRVNYYGRTQTAGQLIDFYQRGVMMGLATDPTDQNVYANEMWFKDAAAAQILSLLLNLPRVPANAAGRAQLLAGLQSVIDQALFNGTISVGKTLTTTQKLYVGTITGDELAWHQVQNIGYWIDCTIQSYVTVDSRTEYKAVYTIVYAKDDAIRKVEGSHVLI